MSDNLSLNSQACEICGAQLENIDRQLCRFCLSLTKVEEVVKQSSGAKVIVNCQNCGIAIAAVLGLKNSKSVWCSDCIEDFQSNRASRYSKRQKIDELSRSTRLVKSEDKIGSSTVEPIRRDLEKSKLFFWIMGISWIVAFLNTVLTASKSGDMSPGSLGGGLGGWALYLLFAGIIWNVIIGAFWAIIRFIINKLRVQ